MSNLSDVIHILPPIKSGDELLSALEVLPEYDAAICDADAPVRLMALSDLYRVYVPNQMSLEIYSKLYLALLRSLQKKGTKLAVHQQNQNFKAIMQQEYSGIMGGSDSFAIIGASGIGKSSASSVFTDVKTGQWYTNAVTWAAEQKVVSGIGNNQFAPNRDISREELATMLWRYAGSPKPAKTTLDFTDAGKVSTFAKEAVLWANEHGIISGKGNGILDPKGKATRAETAQMLMNYLKK